MAKYHGKVGFVQSVESAPGVWIDQATEREYSGDVIRQSKQWTNSGQINDTLVVNSRVSIIADDFASMNVSLMRYVILYGVYWEIKDIEIQRPRIILNVGGIYNGRTA